MEQKTKKMPFAPVKVRREKTEKKLTERQRAAQKRQAEQKRSSAPAKGAPAKVRQQRLNPDKVRITNLIAGELTRAFAVILKLDGPADTLMKAFFKSNPKLGSRDRTILAEAIFLSVAGGAAGIFLVFVLVLLTPESEIVTISLSIYNILSGLLIAAAIGVISGIIPAIKGASLNPVDAINSK